jgi:hypothetical protein
VTRLRLATVAVLALAGAAAPAQAAPRVDQLVVFRNGEAKIERVGTKAVRTRAGDQRCRVPRATPLAALVRSKVADLSILDFSDSCDPSSLFVNRIGPNKNRGQSGWVYKVGNRQGTTAASDPSGPFGRGRLDGRLRVTWFYCVFEAGGCQPTLGVRTSWSGPLTVTATVTAYDDEGRRSRVEDARVRSGGQSAQTDRRGKATFTVPAAGTHRVYAEKRGYIRSFTESVRVPY